MSTDAEFEQQCVTSMRTFLAFKEAQYAEIMRLADVLALAVWQHESEDCLAVNDDRAALEAAVRKLAGLPANSETVARPETE